ncbi:hypothetical protein ALC62_13486, partial [Cyphomyrmex costatus]
LTIFIAAQFWSSIIEIALSRNISQPRNLFIITEYFIDQEKHYYLILLHTYAALSIGGVIGIATGTMLIAYLQHVCGMLSISSYRIERVMKINIQNTTLKNEDLIVKGLIYAIDIHRQAMKLVSIMLSIKNKIIKVSHQNILNIVYLYFFRFQIIVFMCHRYNVQWYIAPLYIQRIILILLQRSIKTFTLGVGGLFIGSLECFATVIK